ncbi:MAG: hypothetical protein ACYDAJ_08015 [Nitrosotalea sp.]
MISVFSVMYNASAEKQLNNAISIPFNDSSIVAVGKIIHATSIVSDNKTQYNVTIEKYLKNPQSSELMNVTGDGIVKKITNFDEVKYYNTPIFEEGDRVFLYLNNIKGQYTISPFSFSITKGISPSPPDYVDFTNYKTTYYGNDVITVSGVIEKGYLYRSVAELGSNSTVSIVVTNPHGEKYLYDEINVQPNGSFDYKFKVKGKYGVNGTYEYGVLVGTSLTGGTFEYVAYPLQQFKSGIAAKDVTCNIGFQNVVKAEDGSPACVKPDTSNILIERGWAKPVQ